MNKQEKQQEREGEAKQAISSDGEQAFAQVLCPVVGIGASAGGLEAFTRLLEHLPATTGMAYVFVQHLDPTHASLLPSLLARVTPMPVREIRDGMPLEPNQVYVLPPNATLVLVLAPMVYCAGEELTDPQEGSKLRNIKHQSSGEQAHAQESGSAKNTQSSH